MTDLLVPARFRGPAASGNGGWTAGALAELMTPVRPAGGRDGGWPPIEVSLRRPPPLDTAMPVHEENGSTVATSGGAVVAEAQVVTTDPVPVDPVDAATARAAEAAYPGLTSHPFPTCFACGTDRAPNDGLRIYPGPVADLNGATRVAATWTPRPSVAVQSGDHASLPATWAALDCIGGWAGDLTERMMVLARMTARVAVLPATGHEHVVVGHHRGTEGRKTFTAATLRDGDGRVLAVAEHLWVAVGREQF